MAENFIQPGDVVNFTAPSGGVTAGTPKQIGQIVVVPQVSAAQGASFAGMVTGVHRVTKVGSQAWAEGAIVYWDEANDRFTTVPTGNLQAGVATAAVGSGAGETTGYVRLDGIGRAQEDT